VASTIYLTVTAKGTLAVAFAGLVFGLFLQQCAFVGHDTAHNGITHGQYNPMKHRSKRSTSMQLAVESIMQRTMLDDHLQIHPSQIGQKKKT
jgi:hypothetical protein